MNTRKLNTLTYEQVLSKWQNCSDVSTIFSGHFLYRLVSELNSIEGIEVSYNRTRELFENEVLRDYSGDIRDIYSVLNNRRVAEYLTECLSKKQEVDLDVIKTVHKFLMFGSIDRHRYEDNRERAGEFRKKEYCVGRYDVGYPAKDVVSGLQELLNVVPTITDTLKAVTVFHCYFSHIHPFADGNGRTVRWLTNYMLILGGHPPVLFDSSKRDIYFKCLEKFDVYEDYDSLYEYLKQETIESYSSWKYLCSE